MLLSFALACHPAAPDAADVATPGAGPADGDTAATVEHIPSGTPGAALFRDDTVHPLALTLDEAAVASLLADPTTYVPAVFTDGDRSLDVGVRLKGFTSFQPLDGKPNLRVSFDHFVDGQRHDGLEAVDFAAEAEDPAAMSEAIAYRVFRAGGQPASRTGFAWLTLNGADYGLYTLVEKKDDVLVEQWWPDDDDGSLYESSSESWPCDLDDAGAPRCDCWEQDEVGGADTRADLEALCAVAADTPADRWYTTIQAEVDWTEVSRHMAMEMVLGAHDHYAGYMGNVYLYHRPEAGRWALLPASMNSAFGSIRHVPGSCGSIDYPPTGFDGGLLARRCWDDAACTADLYDAIAWALQTLEGSDVLARIDAWEVLLEPYVVADTRLGYTSDAFRTQVGCIRTWLAERPDALAPLLPAECLGEGGVLDVTGWGDLSTNGSCDRTFPDAVAYRVTRLDEATVTTATPPEGIAAGDEVVVMVTQAVGGDADAVGHFAFADVVGVSGSALTLAGTPDLGVSGDLAGWKVVVQRVPHYTDVRVGPGGTLTGGAWNGETGGVLALRVSGTLTVEAGGAVSSAASGYAGGATGYAYNVDGYQGESVAGPGQGGGGSVDGYNEATGAWAPNLGGGGCNVVGGGGEHAGGATAADSWDGAAHAAAAGEVYGDADLSRLYFGSGGGGVVNLGGASGPGGAGGGVLFLDAGSVRADGGGALSASGGDGVGWAAGSWSYGAGGGAGGSVWITADTLVLAEGAIRAEGGAGYDAVSRPGGDGGGGRIVVACRTVNGVACSEAAMAGLSAPEAVVQGR